MQADFYHLTRQPLEHVLPRIAAKVAQSGERLLIVSADAGQRAAIDTLLWTFAPDSFLPHAQAGAGEDAHQIALIADTVAVPGNGARHVALADGIWREEALSFDRAFHFFDDAAIVPARAAWKGLAGNAQVTRNYWRQGDDGRWEKVA